MGNFFGAKESIFEEGASTVCMHPVSVAFSLPGKGSFLLSLTVLLHYRSEQVF